MTNRLKSALSLSLALVFALAGDGQHAVVDREVDLFLLQAGQLHGDDEVVLVVEDVERRRPPAEEPAIAARPGEIEQPIHFIAERREAIGGRPVGEFRELVTDETHKIWLMG